MACVGHIARRTHECWSKPTVIWIMQSRDYRLQIANEWQRIVRNGKKSRRKTFINGDTNRLKTETGMLFSCLTYHDRGLRKFRI